MFHNYITKRLHLTDLCTLLLLSLNYFTVVNRFHLFLSVLKQHSTYDDNKFLSAKKKEIPSLVFPIQENSNLTQIIFYFFKIKIRFALNKSFFGIGSAGRRLCCSRIYILQ